MAERLVGAQSDHTLATKFSLRFNLRPQCCSGPPRRRVPQLHRDTPLGDATVPASSSPGRNAARGRPAAASRSSAETRRLGPPPSPRPPVPLRLAAASRSSAEMRSSGPPRPLPPRSLGHTALLRAAHTMQLGARRAAQGSLERA
ncbi:hypothetical protein SEVIR_1G183750v4 [Setaria viridis]